MEITTKQIALTIFYTTFRLNFTPSTIKLRTTLIKVRKTFFLCVFISSTGTPLLSKRNY